MIWTDDYINQLEVDGLQQINQDVQAVWQRFCLATTRGVSVYTLPDFVRSVLRITWRGYGLDSANWEEMTLLTPATVFIQPGDKQNIETSQSRPLYYAMHPTSPYDIRVYPCPDESFASNAEDPYAPAPNGPSCIVTCFRTVDATGDDATAQLPDYIVRRTQKAYVLWKAFAAEGKGQNLAASKYYKMRYDQLITVFRSINEGCFIGKRYSLDDGSLLNNDGFKYPKPTLSPRFERTIFR